MQIPQDWQELLAEHLASSNYARLVDFLAAQRQSHPGAIFPAQDQVYQALHLTPVKQVRVVILGQDPYPTRGHAHGLAFSVQPHVLPLPGSLRNIFKELASDLNVPAPQCGDLRPWAKQGVLLLNSVLTVREGQANSHRNQGWELLTDEIIKRINQQKQSVVFVLWGKPAQKKLNLIDASRHALITAPHPSPLSAYTGFFGSRPFSQINRHLAELGYRQIDWSLASIISVRP